MSKSGETLCMVYLVQRGIQRKLLFHYPKILSSEHIRLPVSSDNRCSTVFANYYAADCRSSEHVERHEEYESTCHKYQQRNICLQEKIRKEGNFKCNKKK
ncbi:hypothetical protein WN51_01942 [Melipona quadrifasciata]|uniref:Uncharacterized protein n=1 Tax=Melipona quadrifasciata TaxID=166423 RepID=A0A0N0U507_9HYME|nr:hypothetical protein WN51_01942 [Melipona quadrifasciata]